MNHILFTAALLGAFTSSQAGDLQLANLFNDHMVIQRDQPVSVWGSANAGEEVSIEFAGQKKTVKTDASGKWLARLDAMRASAEGRVLLVESTDKARKAKVEDVLVGDVWLCSGQSNMHFTLRGDYRAKDEIPAANEPAMRFFHVEQRFGQQPLADVEGTWQQISPETAGGCSAVAYYFGRELQRKVGVPIGLLVSSVGGTRIESWMDRDTISATGLGAGPLFEQWKNVSAEEFQAVGARYAEFQRQRDEVHPQAVKAAKEKGEPAPPAPQPTKPRCHDCPSSLHNGMIHPLRPFAIRGAIWYQGESNSSQPAAYEKLLPAMIADWRKAWGAELPFLFVQLAPYRDTHLAFREAQLHILQKTPHTAMAVNTDVGDAGNIHPTRKRPVGERLALAARALSYGEEIEYSGPVFESMKIEGDRAVVSFTHAGTGLKATAGDLKGFSMAGENGKFLPAKVVIEGATVTVTCDKITKPTDIRYAWAMVPDANLFNHEGLPAVPFRTDTSAAPKPATSISEKTK